MGNVFPSVHFSITWTTTADAEPATALVLPVGVPQYPSVPHVQLGFCSTRVSVWRPVGRDCTPRTLPATIAIPRVVPAWDPWLQTASAVTNQRKLSCCNLASPSMASAQLDVLHRASWIIRRHAESVIPPAGSVPGHLQTTVRPVPPRQACTRAAVSPAARKASSSRTTSAKHATHLAGLALVLPRPTVPPALRRPPYRTATAGRAVKRGIFSMLSPESASNAAQTVSAARQTSRRASAVSVCGVKRQGPGCWAITASLTVPKATTAGMEPA